MSRLLAAFSLALAVLFGGLPAAAQSIGYSPNTLPLSGSCGTVTISTPCLDLTQTWNNVATTFTGLKFNVTDTASAGGSLLMDLQVGGTSRFSVNKFGRVVIGDDLQANSAVSVTNNAGLFQLGASGDVILARDAANTLALRNGTASNTFRVYDSFTDASNGQWAVLGTSAGTAYLATQKNGTGAVMPLQIQVGNTNIWQFTAAGNFVASTDNTYDIGASGANRPRNGYFGTNVTVGNALVLGAGVGQIVWNGRAQLTSPADAVLRLNNAAGTITTDITLSGASAIGGSTATFGGIIASTAQVQAIGFIDAAGRGRFSFTSDGVFQLTNNAATNSVSLTVGASNLLTLNGGLKTTGATFALQTATTLTDNAAAQVATMTNGPAAGNPTKWIAINDNGTTRYIPAW